MLFLLVNQHKIRVFLFSLPVLFVYTHARTQFTQARASNVFFPFCGSSSSDDDGGVDVFKHFSTFIELTLILVFLFSSQRHPLRLPNGEPVSVGRQSRLHSLLLLGHLVGLGDWGPWPDELPRIAHHRRGDSHTTQYSLLPLC